MQQAAVSAAWVWIVHALLVPSDERAGRALEWVVGVMDQLGAPYQVVGGLAVLAHGGSRELHDIDLYAQLPDRSPLLDALAERTQWGPHHFVDESWDLVFMKLAYGGVRIEIGDTSSEPRYFDRSRGAWTSQHIDFDSSERRTVLGVEVNVMPVDQLLAYKTALGRAVDLQDVRELRGV